MIKKRNKRKSLSKRELSRVVAEILLVDEDEESNIPQELDDDAFEEPDNRFRRTRLGEFFKEENLEYLLPKFKIYLNEKGLIPVLFRIEGNSESMDFRVYIKYKNNQKELFYAEQYNWPPSFGIPPEIAGTFGEWNEEK